MEDPFEKFVKVAVNVKMLIEKLSVYGDVTKLDLRYYRIDRKCLENSDNNILVSEELNNMRGLFNEVNSAVELVTISQKIIKEVNYLENNYRYSQVLVDEILEYFLKFKEVRKKSSQSFKMDLKEFYNSLYQVVEIEMREKASSQLLNEIQKDQVDTLGISRVVEKKVKRVIKKKSPKDSIYYGKLSSMYFDFLKGNYSIVKDVIMVSLLVKNEVVMKNALERRYEMLFKKLEVEIDELKREKEQFETSFKDTSAEILGINSFKNRNNFNLGVRVSALALSIALLGGLNYFGHKIIKDMSTTVNYDTNFRKISIGAEDTIVENFENDFLTEKMTPEEKYVFTNYSKIFYDGEKYFRYVQEYSFDYIEGTNLKDYISLDYRDLKPLGKPYKDLDAAKRYDGGDMRSIKVYSQNYDNPHVTFNKNDFVCLGVIMLLVDLVLIFCLPLMPYDDYKAIKRALENRKSSNESYEEKVKYILGILKSLEDKYGQFLSLHEVYNDLVKFINELGIDIDIKDIEVVDYSDLIEQKKLVVRKLTM